MLDRTGFSRHILPVLIAAAGAAMWAACEPSYECTLYQFGERRAVTETWSGATADDAEDECEEDHNANCEGESSCGVSCSCN